MALAGYGRSAVGSLARVEFRRLVGRPLTPVVLVAGIVLARLLAEGEGARVTLNGYGLVPLLTVVFVAVHLAVTRDRRGRTGELVASLPTDAGTRTRAYLAAFVPAAAGLGTAWVATALVIATPGRTRIIDTYRFRGIEWTPTWFELLQPLLFVPVVVLLAVAVGVRWRHPAVAFLVPVVVMFSPIAWALPPVVESGTVEYGGTLVEVTPHAVAWHLLYLAGWGLALTGAALARHERRPAFAVLAGVGLAGVVVGLVLGPLPVRLT